MNQSELHRISEEARSRFTGKVFGRFFQLGRTSFAIDFLPHEGLYLFVDFSFQHASTFLIRRRRKELERSSLGPSRLLIRLQQELQDLEVIDVHGTGTSLVLHASGAGTSKPVRLVIEAASGLPNVKLIGEEEFVIVSARDETEERASRPGSAENMSVTDLAANHSRELSERLDRDYLAQTAKDRLSEKAAAARKKLAAEISKRKRLVANLRGDLERHGDPDGWKRFGDLILANLGQLRREGDSIFVTDFYDPELAELEIPGESNLELTEIANKYFKRYSKARNARQVIEQRLNDVGSELDALEGKHLLLESVIQAGDETALGEFLDPSRHPEKASQPRKPAASETVKGVRRFRSADGFEIWVGKKATDNDVLTFRLAKSLEVWLHAADYPGSHVIIRNPTRKEVPEKTLVQAAELAAFYSDGRSQVRANVRYTQRKFVHKPKRSAPGMVSISSFKTIYVEPRITAENLDART